MADGRGILGAMGRAFARLTTPASPGNGVTIMPFGNMLAGVRMYDPQETMKAAAVWRCVNLVSQTVAMLPWQVFKRSDDGAGERQGKNPVEWLLSHEASEEMTAYDFRAAIVSHTLLYGNGYAEIERTTRGTPFALHLLTPERVTVGRLENGKVAYKVQNGGGSSVVPAADMYHVKGLAFDGLVGYSILEVAARSIATGIAMDDFSEKFFSQGMRPGGFIKTPGKMGTDALKAITDFFRDNYQGAKNMWKPVPLDAGMEWVETQASMEDAQFLELRKFNVLDICRWFGVPPHMVYDLERATFSNIDAQGQDFLNYGLLPRIVPMEQEANRKLLSSNHGGLYSKMNVNAITRGDMEKRSGFYQIMRNTGAFTINDILRLEDMNTIGKQGDGRVMQSQYVAIGPDGAPKTPPPPPPPPKVEPKTEPPAPGEEPPPKANGALNGAHPQ